MANRSTDSTKGISRFMDLNPAIGKHFDKVDKADRGDDDVEEEEDQVKDGGSGKHIQDV